MLYMYVFIVLASETTAISLIKAYSQTPRMPLMLLAMALYTIVSFFLVLSFRMADMGLVNVLWSGLSVVFIETIAICEFHERISHRQLIGITVATAGILIVRAYG